MRNGVEVFDPDAHVVYPADLWSRFLDNELADRIRQRAGNPRLRRVQLRHGRRA
jgi:hypothetical protein